MCIPVYDRFPATYAHSWLEQYQPNKTFYLPAACRKELYQIGKRSRDHDRERRLGSGGVW